MAAKVSRWTDAEIARVLASIAKHKGDKARICREVGAKRGEIDTALYHRGISFGQECQRAKFGKVTADIGEEVRQRHETDVAVLQRRLKALEKELAEAKQANLTDEIVKRSILGLADRTPELPDWLVRTKPASKSPGVPCLHSGDKHWAEVVDPTQIGGVNRYDLATGRRRFRAMVENTIDLLRQHMVRPEYPGIVYTDAGDAFSGDIHDELSATNEVEMMPALLDLFGCEVWAIETLAEEFGHVFVPRVRGNHPRTSRKPRAKGSAFTNYDWLLAQLLAKHFEKDKRVQFLIPSGPDALFRIYGHRYLLTHGDQFRGGDGMIGALGPIIRGDHRKRSRNGQIGQGYDTLLLGHWHQDIRLRRLIVCPSLKGYDEYAFANNFPYEEPGASLWITHPTHGITVSMPVLVEKGESKSSSAAWVEWSEAA